MIREDNKETDAVLTEKISGDENEDSEQAVNESLADVQQRAKLIAFSSPGGFLAFGFGSGLLTNAPGTMGTLAAVPIAILLSYFNLNGFLFLLFTFLVGVRICGNVSKKLGVEDYGGIVWDEMVSYWLVVAFVPLQWGWFLAAFLIFRAFDILKPWPISIIEESFGGGLGIMLDDVLAAVYTIIILSFVEQMLMGA